MNPYFESFLEPDMEEVCREALDAFGPQNQTVKCFEEMAELQKELCKAFGGQKNANAIAEEIADLQITLEQMILLHECAGQVEEWKTKKLRRLMQLIHDNKDDDIDDSYVRRYIGMLAKSRVTLNMYRIMEYDNGRFSLQGIGLDAHGNPVSKAVMYLPLDELNVNYEVFTDTGEYDLPDRTDDSDNPDPFGGAEWYDL